MNHLSSTEKDVLKFICKFDNSKIAFIENLELNDSERVYLIFDVILNVYEKGRKLERGKVKK